MIKIIEYLMIDDISFLDKLPEEERAINLEKMLVIAKNITIKVIYDMFLEEPHEHLVIAISCNKQFEVNEILYEVFLREYYYQKHIGKFIEEVQCKIINDLVVKLTKELDKVNWTENRIKECNQNNE